mmetsp:Transcript_25574/g.101969  ORF Transcript_25574/g.101969 Transcript_25574/m.101969 type:complete len:273 (-) Transcript_25574:50-868(-)
MLLLAEELVEPRLEPRRDGAALLAPVVREVRRDDAEDTPFFCFGASSGVLNSRREGRARVPVRVARRGRHADGAQIRQRPLRQDGDAFLDPPRRRRAARLAAVVASAIPRHVRHVGQRLDLRGKFARPVARRASADFLAGDDVGVEAPEDGGERFFPSRPRVGRRLPEVERDDARVAGCFLRDEPPPCRGPIVVAHRVRREGRRGGGLASADGALASLLAFRAVNARPQQRERLVRPPLGHEILLRRRRFLDGDDRDLLDRAARVFFLIAFC